MELIINKLLHLWRELNTIHVLLSLASNLDLCLQQFDVKNAFICRDFGRCVYESIVGFRQE